MGANIGTTMTAWLLSLTGIQGDSLFIQLLKPTSFTPILALIGVGMMMFSKKTKRQDIGSILIGFAVLMFGMDQMSSAVKPLASDERFTSVLLMFDNPLFGLAAGMLLTAIIQSSSASVGILQALSMTGAISWGMAVPIILGQNIGTCVTALLSGIGTNKNAKRAAMIHLYFNIIGALFMLIVYLIARAAMGEAAFAQPITISGIAIVHTTFNLTTALFFCRSASSSNGWPYTPFATISPTKPYCWTIVCWARRYLQWGAAASWRPKWRMKSRTP